MKLSEKLQILSLGYLEFTSDIPERHQTHMVPMLDVQVWVEHADPDTPGTSDKLGWCFYDKPSSSHRVLRASSAYSWRGKIVSLTMKVHRRIRNGVKTTDNGSQGCNTEGLHNQT